MDGDSTNPSHRLKKKTTWRKLGRESLDWFRHIEFEDPLRLHVASTFIFGSRAQERVQSRRCSFGL